MLLLKEDAFRREPGNDIGQMEYFSKWFNTIGQCLDDVPNPKIRTFEKRNAKNMQNRIKLMEVTRFYKVEERES